MSPRNEERLNSLGIKMAHLSSVISLGPWPNTGWDRKMCLSTLSGGTHGGRLGPWRARRRIARAAMSAALSKTDKESAKDSLGDHLVLADLALCSSRSSISGSAVASSDDSDENDDRGDFSILAYSIAASLC